MFMGEKTITPTTFTKSHLFDTEKMKHPSAYTLAVWPNNKIMISFISRITSFTFSKTGYLIYESNRKYYTVSGRLDFHRNS